MDSDQDNKMDRCQASDLGSFQKRKISRPNIRAVKPNRKPHSVLRFYEKVVLLLMNEVEFEKVENKEDDMVIEDIEDMDSSENEDTINVAVLRGKGRLPEGFSNRGCTQDPEEHRCFYKYMNSWDNFLKIIIVERNNSLHNSGDIVVMDIEDIDESQEEMKSELSVPVEKPADTVETP